MELNESLNEKNFHEETERREGESEGVKIKSPGQKVSQNLHD